MIPVSGRLLPKADRSLRRLGGREMIVDLNEERREKQRGDRWDRWFAILEQDALIETKSRAFRALWIESQDASAGRKREILLSLREQSRALPTHIQEELWQELY